MTPLVRIACWRVLAALALLLGTIGIVLPGLPTVPFYLVAAWAGSKGWPRLEQWLLAHQHYGPLIEQWRRRRAVPRRAKYLAALFMSLSVALLWLAALPVLVQMLLTLVMVAVLIWLCSLPDAHGNAQ